MLHSNTSIFEAIFLIVWLMRKETAQHYPKVLSTIQKCKSCSHKEVAATYEPNSKTAMENTFDHHDIKHNDIMRQIKEKATIKSLTVKQNMPGNHLAALYRKTVKVIQPNTFAIWQEKVKLLELHNSGILYIPLMQIKWTSRCYDHQYTNRMFLRSPYNEKTFLHSACKWLFDILLKGFKI